MIFEGWHPVAYAPLTRLLCIVIHAVFCNTVLAETCELASLHSRQYHLCRRSPATTNVPIIIWLHCFGCAPMDMQGLQTDPSENLVTLALHRNWAVAFPHGEDRSWNGGPCCGTAKERGLDDVGFVAQVAARLKDDGFGPIFLGGYSNGGFLTAKIAQKSGVSDRFLGFAMLSGHQYDGYSGITTPKPFMLQHGEEDDMVRYTGCCGGNQAASKLCCCGISTSEEKCVGAAQISEKWARQNRCRAGVAPSPWSPPKAEDATVSLGDLDGCTTFTGCVSLSVFCQRKKMNHFLPFYRGVMPSVMAFYQTVLDTSGEKRKAVDLGSQVETEHKTQIKAETKTIPSDIITVETDDEGETIVDNFANEHDERQQIAGWAWALRVFVLVGVIGIACVAQVCTPFHPLRTRQNLAPHPYAPVPQLST